MIEISLGIHQAGKRLDKVLKRHLKEAPDSFIYKMLRKKNITLNHEKAVGDEKTVAGDTVQFYLSQETYDKMRGGPEGQTADPDPTFPEIRVLYEDSDVCIFVKPPGILSQKARPEDFSINEWVIWHSVEAGIVSASDFESFRPSVVNRLDRNTGGIMCAGMSERGLQVLSELFRTRQVKKTYAALVRGKIEAEQDLTAYLLKDPYTNRVTIYNNHVKDSKEIRTVITPVKNFKDRTLVHVRLLSGRSHQIRAQLRHISHPILGDPKYGDPAFNMKYGILMQCLYAYRLEFPATVLSGISGKTFSVEVPEEWPLGPAGA